MWSAAERSSEAALDRLGGRRGRDCIAIIVVDLYLPVRAAGRLPCSPLVRSDPGSCYVGRVQRVVRQDLQPSVSRTNCLSMTATTRWSILVAIALSIAFLRAMPCGAQEMAPPAEHGARIRVLRTGDRTPQEATLVSFDHDTLVMELGDCCVLDTIPTRSLASVDVSRGAGVDAGRVLGGMTWGLLAGLGAGWLVTEVGCRFSDGNELCALGFLKWGTILGAGGLVAGILWGTEGGTERWERIYPPTDAMLLVAPTSRGGLAIGAAIPVDFGSPRRAASRQ